MITQLSSKIVKTRKPHECFACRRKFEAGTIMECGNNVDGGKVYSLYACSTCQKIMEVHTEWVIDPNENSFPYGCVWECIGEFPNVSTPEELLELLNKEE